MSIDKTDIGNLALQHVGQPPVMRIDDKDNDTARVLDLVFEPALREMGRDHEWNCLKTRTTLAQSSPAPDFGFSYRYRQPTDCIRVLRVNGRDVDEPTDLYEIEGRDILTDADTMKLQYIRYTEDTTLFDSLFVEALAILIASKVAVTIRQDERLAASLTKQYLTVILPRARKVDGNERNKAPYDARQQSRSLGSRQSGTFNGRTLV